MFPAAPVTTTLTGFFVNAAATGRAATVMGTSAAGDTCAMRRLTRLRGVEDIGERGEDRAAQSEEQADPRRPAPHRIVAIRETR